MRKKLSFVTLRRFNHFLTLLVIGLALYMVLTPFMPEASWWVKHQAPLISRPATIALPTATPTQNTVVIPSIGLQEIIHEGATKATLHRGVWHRPGTSSPELGGNTVLAGHRFTYHDPAVFYNLNKVALNDPIVAYWKGQRYDYRVTEIRTVQPTAVEVEAPTKRPRLTLYTCTPLWTSNYRLVIIAEPKDES